MREYNKIIQIIITLSMILTFLLGSFRYAADVSAASAATDKKTYTVTFDPQGGTVNTEEKTVTPGSKYGSLPTPVKANYTFRGWYIFPSGGTMINAEKLVSIAKDHTLYAQWNGKDFTVTLDANEGKLDTTKVTVRYGTKYLQQLPKPTRVNYEFSGWYTQKKGGDEITSASVYKDNPPKKLYARWDQKILTIQFIAFNGETYEKKVTCGSTYGTLPKPKKEGSTFDGWYTWTDYSNSDAVPIVSTTQVTDTSPVKLFARWH